MLPRRSEDHDGANEVARAAAFSPSPNLPLAAADGDVDPAPDHGGRALFRHRADRVVADRGRLRAERLREGGSVLQFEFRPADPARLHLGVDPSHAGRRSAFDLGHRPRLYCQ